jgi:hypothetical protein
LFNKRKLNIAPSLEQLGLFNFMECYNCKSKNLKINTIGRYDAYCCKDCEYSSIVQNQCCSHQNKIFVRVEQGQGVVQRTACNRCKHIFGTAVKKDANFYKYPLVTLERHLQIKELDESCYTMISDWVKCNLEKYIQKKQFESQKESIEWWNMYNKYLLTEKWKEIRKKVLERENYICQGCLKNKAVQAHHLTYNNVTDELLFQLISVCLSCHNKLHKDKI